MDQDSPCQTSSCNDRSSSSLSWEDMSENDEEATSLVTKLLESIDNIIFDYTQPTQELPDDLVNECLVWRKKFLGNRINHSCSCNKLLASHKSKSLSAPKLSWHSHDKLKQRSWSEQEFGIKIKAVNLVPIEASSNKLDDHKSEKIVSKPLTLPPIDLEIKKRQKISRVSMKLQSFPQPPTIMPIKDLMKNFN